MRQQQPPRIAVAPAGLAPWLDEAVTLGGGHLVAVEDAEGIVWADAHATGLDELLEANPGVRWVQLPWAGVDRFLELFDAHDVTWTCAKGVFSEPVAELALGLILAGMRQIGSYARTTTWTAQKGLSLLGARVTILGGGGITEALLRLLAPFDCHVTVVRNNVAEMEGAAEVLEAERYVDALPGADVVVLALALTPETERIIGASELAMMESHAWLINVARGRHIVTDDLVEALTNGTIAGAGLDVLDPEPLPDGHPLWSMDNCLITPHVGTTDAMGDPLLARRVTENVRRFAEGAEMLGIVNPELGY